VTIIFINHTTVTEVNVNYIVVWILSQKNL